MRTSNALRPPTRKWPREINISPNNRLPAAGLDSTRSQRNCCASSAPSSGSSMGLASSRLVLRSRLFTCAISLSTRSRTAAVIALRDMLRPGTLPAPGGASVIALCVNTALVIAGNSSKPSGHSVIRVSSRFSAANAVMPVTTGARSNGLSARSSLVKAVR
ncbi:hypothetical protein D9M71_148760 [compost metagenome]